MSHANISIFVPHKGCPNQCSFCNQKSIASTSFVPDGDFVRKECKAALEKFKGDTKSAQIAFFGGSFTAIERPLMVELLQAAREFLGDGGFDSIRISTRPDCIDEEILSLLEKYGVKSIELGAQSMKEETLLLNRRGHTAFDVANASAMIKSRGFELGLQMMVGLYGDSTEDVFETARKIADINPDTVRIYPTIVIKNTYLAELYTSGKYHPLGVEDASDICAKLLDFFEGRGIKVIRLGLHDSETLKSDMLAGPYHPAFREICDSKRLFSLLSDKLCEHNTGKYKIYVAPEMVSKFVGQKRSNVMKLKEIGYDVKIIADGCLKNNNFYIEGEER